MRLFVAVNLPEAIRQELWDASAALRAPGPPVRWVGPDALHVTIKFLGPVEESREPEILAGLEEAVQGARPFTLPLAGFGAFPTPERPRVVWAGCDGVPPLELLQDRVERCMSRLGFPIEGRPFRPHVTIGRVRDGARPRDLAPLKSRLGGVEFAASCMVESLDLMESLLSPQGARYVVRRAVHLPA